MTLSSKEVTSALDIVEVKPGLRFSLGTLKDLLPDAETLLFFGKVYELDHVQVSRLLKSVLDSDLTRALFAGDHSVDLQDYIIDDLDTAYYGIDDGEIVFNPEVPKGEVLPEVWKMLEVEVAESIKAVASKLERTVALLPGKKGSMVFRSMMQMNKRRPTMGTYAAGIEHARQKENLLILDVSGSVTSGTVERIVNDVVALSYEANAHFAIVSNETTHWAPGAYDVDAVLRAATYGGTHYETLHELMNMDWGTVICIADYDSSPEAKHAIARCTGHIDQVLDVSLVNRPTFLGEVVGQKADAIRPLLIATSSYVLSS